MPEVIRNRFRDQSALRDSEFQDTTGARVGFGFDEDPLDELARIVGDTAPAAQSTARQAPASPGTARRAPGEQRDTAGASRDYPRRDTSWRDPGARTTVRAGITPQPMPGQLEDLEAELFNEIRSENLRNLPPAPNLDQFVPQSARSDARLPQSDVHASGGRAPAQYQEPQSDDEVTLPMHAVLRSAPSAARHSEDVGMMRSTRSTSASGHLADESYVDTSGHREHAGHEFDDEQYYADHGELDPAGAYGHPHEAGVQSGYYGADDEGYAVSSQGLYPVRDAGPDDEDDYVQPTRRQERLEPKRARSTGMFVALSLVGVLVVGVGSVFAYKVVSGRSLTGGDIPLIRADGKPVKEQVVQQPITATGPNLDAAKSTGQDKLVTQAEDPVDQIPGKPPVRVVGSGIAGNNTLAPIQRVHSVIVRPDGTIVTPDAPAPQQPVRTASADAPAPVVPPVSQPAPAVSAPAATLPPVTPPVTKPVATAPVVVAPKPSVAAAPAQQAPAVQPPAAVKPVVKPIASTQPALVPHAPQPAPEANAPMALGPSSAPAQPVRLATAATPPAASAAPSAPAPTHATTPDAGSGDYMVQISSQRSDAEARHALAAAEQKYASLGIKGGDVQQADLGARGMYYRARLAGGTHEQAVALCSQIKAQGGDCVVAKR